MTRILLFVALTVVVSGGCKKAMDKLENSASQPAAGGNQDGPYSGGGNPTVGGAVQGVRGAGSRTVTAVEMHDLHIFMYNAKGSLGRVPTAQETMAEITQPTGNRQLAKMIQDGLIVLVPNPAEEGLWAYAKEAPTQGGWIITQSGEERVTAADFNSRFGRK